MAENSIICSHENELRPSGLSEFTMVAEMVFEVLFCAFGLISVQNSFSVQSETDNEISNSQPFAIVKGVISWEF